MGMVEVEITLKNLEDEMLAHLGYKKYEDIRTATVKAVADTGAGKNFMHYNFYF